MTVNTVLRKCLSECIKRSIITRTASRLFIYCVIYLNKRFLADTAMRPNTKLIKKFFCCKIQQISIVNWHSRNIISEVNKFFYQNNNSFAK